VLMAPRWGTPPGACLNRVRGQPAHTVGAAMRPPLPDDRGRLKARLSPMRGLNRLRSTRVISTGHAFVQNLHRGHYEFGMDVDPRRQLSAAFAEFTLAV
jgi:IS6 family transposase